MREVEGEVIDETRSTIAERVRGRPGDPRGEHGA